MILNTGQRTDIPAFFPEWFANRIKEGYVLVRNPYNSSLVTRYEINPQVPLKPLCALRLWKILLFRLQSILKSLILSMAATWTTLQIRELPAKLKQVPAVLWALAVTMVVLS